MLCISSFSFLLLNSIPFHGFNTVNPLLLESHFLASQFQVMNRASLSFPVQVSGCIQVFVSIEYVFSIAKGLQPPALRCREGLGRCTHVTPASLEGLVCTSPAGVQCSLCSNCVSLRLMRRNVRLGLVSHPLALGLFVSQ